MSFFKEEYLSPKEACERLGVHYQTLRNWNIKGKIKAIRSPGGKRFYNVKDFLEKTEFSPLQETNKTKKEIRKKVCYCRVNSYSQKTELTNQINFMKSKYPEHIIMTDVGSGINFNRGGLRKIINLGIKNELEELVIAYKDRLCRIGYDLIEYLLKEYSNTNIIIEKEEFKSPEVELTEDLIEIITVFSSKLYGMRSYKIKQDNKT